MINSKITSPLLFAPTGEYVQAKVVPLTPDMVNERIRDGWWNEGCLKPKFDPEPIDRDWDWNELGIEYDGRQLRSENVAIIVGDDPSIQGAMMISVDPIESQLRQGDKALFVELLFTAPRNRPLLRADGREYLKGVGTELITWAAWFSRESGYGGRLLLDGSPEYVRWYQKRGLQTLGFQPILYQGVNYTPMELSIVAAEMLLGEWEAT